MTRILHLLETADPKTGGPLEAAYRLGEQWARAGHVQDIVTLDAPSENHIPDYPGKVVPLGPPRGRSLAQRFRYDAEVVPWLKANAPNYDAVIVSGLWRYQALAGFRALANGPTPYFVFPHGMLDPWFRKRYPLKHMGKQLSWWFAEGPLLSSARAVIFTCEEEQLLAEGAFWPYKVTPAVTAFGTADVEGDPTSQVLAFRQAMPQLDGRRFLLFLSRIHPKKGCDLLIDAFAELAATDPTIDLVIAGPDQVGLVKGFRAQAAALGVGERVHFPGMLTGDVKFGAFRAADAFALTSHQENFGIVVAEALAVGTPVLISDKVNIWREVAADGAGLVAPDTVEGAKGLLLRYAQLSPMERVEMGEAARACFLKRFRIQESAASLMQVIEARISAEPHRRSQ